MDSSDRYEGEAMGLPPLILPELTRDRKTNDDYMVDLVSASNELRKLTLIAGCAVPVKEIEARHAAILIGLMVRLHKLYDSYVQLICDKKSEIAMILGRAMGETVINLSYLISENDANVYRDYLIDSMRTGKQVFDAVEQDKLAGVGQPFIQKRIQSDITEQFESVGISMTDPDLSGKSKWGTMEFRAKSCGMDRTYLFIFKNLSRVVHGGWFELDKYHLQKDGALWFPNHKYNYPRPQLLDGSGTMVAEATYTYLEFMVPNVELLTRIQTIRAWLLSMCQRHEEFLSHAS